MGRPAVYRAIAILVIAAVILFLASPVQLPESLKFNIKGSADEEASHDPAINQKPQSGLVPTSSITKPSEQRHRLLILFMYYESEAARENIQYFLRHGVHDAADFIFIFNGETNASDFVPTTKANIRTVHRNNTCFDLGAMGEVLRTDDLWKKYDRFITMNASVRGPFLPYWSKSCWSDLFLDLVTDEVKLVGITVNCWPQFHVQSMIWATDTTGMGLLLDPARSKPSTADYYGSEEDPVGLSGCYNEYNQAVHAEVGTTSIITKAGYKADALFTSFHKNTDPKTYCASVLPNIQDTLREGDYFGFSIHPYETIFIKTNRGISPTLIEHLTEWTKDRGYTSYARCKA